MKPEMILKADMLDILFENRNKNYGAYELRSHYNNRLKKATGTMLGIVFLFIVCNFWKVNNSTKAGAGIFIPPDSKLAEVDLVKPVEIKPPPKTTIATIKNATPIIVPKTALADPPPPIEELENGDKQTGTENKVGDPFTSVYPSAESGQSTPSSTTVIKEPEEPEVLANPEIFPEFPGGKEALLRFMHRNLRFDFDDMEPGSRIDIRCKFIVDKQGNVTGIEIIKSGGRAEFDKEVTRVVSKMPQWKPGVQRGKNISAYFVLPVVVEVPEQ